MGGFLDLFSSGRVKELEAENVKLQQKVTELTRYVRTAETCDAAIGLDTVCAVLIMDMNDTAFSVDPDVRERVRNFTMLLSHVVGNLKLMDDQQMLKKLVEQYIPSVISGIRYLTPKTKLILLDTINSIENVLFERISGYVEYKRMDAAATLKAMDTSIKMNTVQLPRGGVL
jgi:hypothetical protein